MEIFVLFEMTGLGRTFEGYKFSQKIRFPIKAQGQIFI